MRITLNLATRPYADLGPAIKQLRIGMAVLAVLLLGLGFGLFHFHKAAVQMQAKEQILDQAIAKIRQEELGYQAQMQQPANARVLTQAIFLNDLFDEKSFSWTETMEDLEPVLPGGVQVTAIEPNRGKDGRLTLRLRISGPRERSVQMIRNMERSARFVSPRLARESAESANGSGDIHAVSIADKVSFEILAEYSQATLEERKVILAAERGGHPAVTAQMAKTPARPTVVPRPLVNQPPMTNPRANPAAMPHPGVRNIPPQTPPSNSPILRPTQRPRPVVPGGPQ